VKNTYGGYSPLTIPTEVLAAAPKAVQQLWGKVTTAQALVTDARQQLGVLEREADQAPDVDKRAAAAAVAAGKPIPPSTVVATHDAAEQQRRAVTAVIDHADDVESNFLNALNAHRDEMTGSFHASAVQALDDALAALSAAGAAVDRFTTLGALWEWSRSEDGGQPGTYAYHLTRVQGQDVTALIDSCALALDKAHPDEVLAAEAAYMAAVAASRGIATADGMVADYAGRRALYAMGVE
jgi:hypothetical protein